jgi:pantetheine-phosphate adenylyltransferase
MSERIAVFPGTFDPFTNGHLDLTRRAVRLFDKVVVAIAENPGKGTLFQVEERAEMIRESLGRMKRVEVVAFSDLVVSCAKRTGAMVMIRGLRAVSDFEFEFQMALMNRRLSPALEVAFLMPSQRYTYLNSTLVKEVARLGGRVTGLVPSAVERRLKQRLRHAAGTPAAVGKVPRPAAATEEPGRENGRRVATKRAMTPAKPATRAGRGRAPAGSRRG